MNIQHQKGFSLVELSIVVLIMGLILGGLAMPLSVQRENARINESQDQLEDVESAVEGFALTNGYLPCPATPSSAGLAATGTGVCTVQHGFVPATTLSLDGRRNSDNLLLDPWGSPLRYSVTSSDANSDGTWDFVNPGEMQLVTMSVLQPDLVVCSTATGATATDCSGPAATLANRSPLVIYSLGKDWSSFTSADQVENAGATLGGGPSSTNYPIAANIVFVSRSQSDQSGSEYDDVIKWMSANALYSRLVEVGRLP